MAENLAGRSAEKVVKQKKNRQKVDEKIGEVQLPGGKGTAQRSIPQLQQLRQQKQLEGKVQPSPAAPKEPEDQISMLDLSSQQVCQALRGISVETLTPIEAMNELYKLRKMLE